MRCENQIRLDMWSQVWDQVRVRVWDQVQFQVRDQMRYQVAGPVWDQLVEDLA